MPASSQVLPRCKPGPRLTAETNRSPACTKHNSRPSDSTVHRTNIENASIVTPAEKVGFGDWPRVTIMAVAIPAAATSQPNRRPTKAPPR